MAPIQSSSCVNSVEIVVDDLVLNARQQTQQVVVDLLRLRFTDYQLGRRDPPSGDRVDARGGRRMRPIKPSRSRPIGHACAATLAVGEAQRARLQLIPQAL